MTITIRLAEPSEWGRVGELTEAAYRADGFLNDKDPYSSTLRDAPSRAGDAELWVAADGEHILATVTYCLPGSAYRELATADDQGEFRMLAVDPLARRRGIARLLVEHCLTRSAGLGHREMVICSERAMVAAHAMYLSMGFQRASALDWQPVPGVELWGFRRSLVRTP